MTENTRPFTIVMGDMGGLAPMIWDQDAKPCAGRTLELRQAGGDARPAAGDRLKGGPIDPTPQIHHPPARSGGVHLTGKPGPKVGVPRQLNSRWPMGTGVGA